MDEPLIYTSRGNVPESSLERTIIPEWHDDPDGRTSHLLLAIEWRDKADGVEVKREVILVLKKGQSVFGEPGRVGNPANPVTLTSL